MVMRMDIINSVEIKVCRLCLKSTFDDCLTITQKIATEISDVVLSCLNFRISNNPLMCKECETSLQNAIGFKSSRKMLPSLYSDGEMVQHLCATYEFNRYLADMKLCHFCMNFPVQVRRTPEAIQNVFLLEILCELSAELKMISTEDPAACDKCFQKIQDILHFITTCFTVEEKIESYVKIEGTGINEQINLSDVQIFLHISKYNWDISGDIGVNETKCLDEINEEIEYKFINDCADNEADELDYANEASEEESEIKIVSENENSITLTVNNLTERSYLDPTEEEIHIKNEDIEIKSEDDFNSFVDRKTVQDSKLWVCKLCTYASKYRHCLERHILSHKSSSEVDLFQCNMCDFTTKYKSGLNRHMITHQDVGEAKIYKCDKCPFQTKHKYGTVKHALVHKDALELTTFKCMSCERAFKRKEQLRKHVLTHMKSTLPKYKCDVCNYESIWKDNLTVHTLVHKDASEVKMFKCHLCSHETKLKASLRLHLATHDKRGKKWHRCQACEYKSRYEGFVRRHFRMNHENEEGEGS